MTEINLYKAKKLNESLPFPTDWNDLLPAELELISAVMLSKFADSSATRAQLLNSILHIRAKKNKIRLPKNIINQMDPEDAVMNGYPLLDFVFNSNTLTKQPYPTIPLPGLRSTTVYGPADDYDNITCGEYEDTEVMFYNFNEDPQQQSLATLAAILYRPKNIPYLRYRDNLPEYYKYEKRVPFFMKLPVEKLFTIYLWYQGCRNMMTEYFPDVFVKSKKAAKGNVDKISFTKCMHAGSGVKNGTLKEIEFMFIKKFFFGMNEEAKAVKEMREAHPKK